MGRYLYQAALSCSQLFSLVVLLSTGTSALCADTANTASFAQGVQDFNAKNYSGAKKSLSAYVVANPNDYKGHFYLANSLVKLGRLDEASDEYKKVLTLTPDSNVANYSMGAFNRIGELRSQSQAQRLGGFANNASLPAPPQTQIAQPQIQVQQPQTQFQPAQITANNQFGYGARPNSYNNNAGNSNDLIPASVVGSGAKLSPTVNGRDPNSFSNNGQFGGRHGRRFQNQGYNPYMNGAPSGPMSSMSNAGQFGNPQFGNSQFGNSNHMGRHHGRRFQQGYMGGGGGANNSYSRNAARNHMGGYIKNYEITDTPSGDAVPLVADQKKFEDLAPQKVAATKPKSAIGAKKVAQKKVLNRN